MPSQIIAYKSVFSAILGVSLLLGGCTSQAPQSSNKVTPVVHTVEYNNTVDSTSSSQVNTPEQTVHLLITNHPNSTQNVQQIIELLPKLNWSTYAQINQVPADEVWGYLYDHLDLITKNDYPSIIQASSNVDGAIAETYASIVGNLFQNNRQDFVQLLAEIDNPNLQQSVLSKIAFDLSSNHLEAHKQQMIQWQKEHSLPSQENQLIDDLLEKLDHPY